MPTPTPKRPLLAVPRLACLALLLVAKVALAGPPFLTDDPEPVDLHHWEFYLFGAADRTSSHDYALTGPAIELNYGVAPDTQLHLVAPLTTVAAAGAATQSGFGDMEVGVKYRFLHESADSPQVGIFPMAELPTGDSAQGLGNGRTWFRLPLWIQKSWGPWTSYGGGGIALNSAPGQRNYGFGGWLLQRDINPHLTLGGEVFGQGADTTDDRGFAAVNLGGSINVSDSFSILFSAGHSFAGDTHFLAYLGLYWTWGPRS